VYESDSEVRTLFLNPVQSLADKEAQLDELFAKQGVKSKEAQQFIKAAAATKSMNKIKQIVNDFDKLVTWALKEVHAVVTTAEPLNGQQVQRLENALRKRVSGDQKLLLKQDINPNIMGGMVVSEREIGRNAGILSDSGAFANTPSHLFRPDCSSCHR
jgi:F0F1-type ATP synthase delta subunit